MDIGTRKWFEDQHHRFKQEIDAERKAKAWAQGTGLIAECLAPSQATHSEAIMIDLLERNNRLLAAIFKNLLER